MFINGYDATLLDIFYKAQVSLYLTIPLLFWVNSFIGSCIFILGYIILGYILRRKYLNINESFIVIFKRFVSLFGFVLIISVVWVLMLLIISSKKRNALAGVAQVTSLGILSMFKFFLYLNIVRVSLGDEKVSFKETYEYVKKDIYQMLRLWFGSGLTIAAAFFVFMFVVVVLLKTGVIQNPEANNYLMGKIFIGFMIAVFVFRAFAEQIGLFGAYLKDKYSTEIFNN